MPISKEEPVDTKEGFTLSGVQAVSAEVGIFAKFLSLSGVGQSSEIKYEKNVKQVLSFDKFDTLTFDQYVEMTMEQAPSDIHREVPVLEARPPDNRLQDRQTGIDG